MELDRQAPMSDIVLDTNVLADFLTQYFGIAQRGKAIFVTQDTISKDLARKINQIILWHDGIVDDSDDDDGERDSGLIVASAFAFAEIARKWSEIVRDRFTVEELAGFIEQPPEWFNIAPVDESLVEAFSYIPIDVLMVSGKTKAIEWTDAVHVATAVSRGDRCLLATTDHRIRQIEVLTSRLI